MKDLLYEILEEAEERKVIIDGEEWPIGFNSQIEENGRIIIRRENEENNAFLLLKNEKRFLELLEEYVSLEIEKNRKIPPFVKEKEKNTKKWILSYLFINFTTEEFLNPIESIQKKIQFLQDNTFDSMLLEIPLDSLDSILKIENEINPIAMETPKKISISIQKQVNDQTYTYPLPSIYYGIATEKGEKVCYVYSIQQSHRKEQTTDEEMSYRSKINRKLFQLNSDVKELEDFQSEEEHNIKDVTMSFVYSLNVFLSLLQAKNIQKIKVVSYLPLRYYSRAVTAKQKNRPDLNERNNEIQMNLTNKLIRTFRRASVHNKDLEILSFPYENDEYLTLKLDNRTNEIDNMLLEEVSEKVNHSVTK